MMEVVPEEHISQGTWEIHRALLAKLYVGENKSVKDIKAYMMENNHFMATEKQYQAYFNKWGFKKNLKKSDWEYIQHRTQKRKAEGKSETAVYLNGVEVSSKRVKKELNRHFPPRFSAHASASSPQTPPGVIVKTPESSSPSHELFALPEVFGDPLISLKDLPLFDSIDGTPENIPTPELLDALGISTASPSHNPTVIIRLNNLPWFRFLDLFRSFDGKPQSPHTVANVYNSPSKLQELVQKTFAGTFRGNLGSDHGSTSRIVRAFLPTGEEELNFQTLAGNPGSSALLQFFKYLAYMASNNMVALDKIDDFLRWISETPAYSTLDSFLSLRTTTSTLLGNLLFGSALRCEDAAAVKCLLRAGVNPSTRVSQFHRFPKSYINPLHLAAKNGNAELVGILLDGGAEIDAMLSMELYDEQHFFITSHNRARAVTPLHLAAFYKRFDVVQTLLSRGCKVNKIARFPFSTSVLELALRPLINFSAHAHQLKQLFSEHEFFDRDGGSTDETRTYNSVRIFEALTKAGAVVHLPTDSCTDGTALEKAACARNISLVCLFLDAGADVDFITGTSTSTTTTNCSIRNCSCSVLLQIVAALPSNTACVTELARRLLDEGARVNYPAKSIYGTSLYAAIFGSTIGRDRTIISGMKEVFTSEYQDNMAVVKKLLQAGADPNARAIPVDDNPGAPGHEERPTVLELAARIRQVSPELIRLLLDSGAEVNAQSSGSSYTITALGGAARHKNLEVVRLLLEHGADVNHSPNVPRDCIDTPAYRPLSPLTPLQHAVKSGMQSIVELLLERGAHVNAMTAGIEETAMRIAIQNKDIAIIRTLTDYGATARAVDVPCDMPLSNSNRSAMVARELQCLGPEGEWELIEAITDAEPHPAHISRLLIRAVLLGRGDLCEYLLQEFATKYPEEWTFHTLVETVEIPHVNIPIPVDDSKEKKGVSMFQERNYTPLEVAAERGHLQMVKVLLRAGAYVNRRVRRNGITWTTNGLSMAAKSGNLALVRLLIANGASIDATDPRGKRTALVQASKNGHDDIVKFLIDSGAEVNARPALGGFTAIQAAARAGNREMVDTLLAADANINAAADGDFGRTALQAAIQNDHVELAHHLIEQGADIHAPPAKRGGVTALQAASIRGQLGFAILLLQKGADANASPAEEDGRTALEGAAEHGRLDMVQLLLNCNADMDDESEYLLEEVHRAHHLALKEGHTAVAKILFASSVVTKYSESQRARGIEMASQEVYS